MANISDLDSNLARDVSGEDISGYELHTLQFEGSTVSNQAWQVLWHPDFHRAGVVFVGSGSSGQTFWTDADSPEDALRRVVEDDLLV